MLKLSRLHKQLFALAPKGFYQLLIGIVAAISLYAFVLLIPFSPELGLSVRYNPVFALIVIFATAYPSYRSQNRFGAFASLCITLVLFALPLTGLWNSGFSDPAALGGLLPLSDGAAYYHDAKLVLAGGQLGNVSAGRPLFPGMLVTLLGLTGQNLQATLAILVAVNAIACFLFAREVQRSHGAIAGVVVLAVLFLFYTRFSGTTWTENLGLALGAVSFALLWRGARARSVRPVLLGLLLLTLALNARAGAMFVLPVLVVWGSWFFGERGKFSLHFLAWAAGTVLSGFTINFLVLLALGRSDAVAFSNFSYVLYGLAVGGKNWMQVMTDYPELRNLELNERSQKIYQLAFEAIRSNPANLLLGAFKAWSEYLNPLANYNVLSFVRVGIIRRRFLSHLVPLITYVLYALYGLSLLGILRCYSQRRNPAHSLLLAACFGIFISVPFAPPVDAQGMRVYAATIPVSAALPAIGLSFLTKKKNQNFRLKVSDQSIRLKVLPLFGIFLLLLSFLGPITTKALSRAAQLKPVTCQENEETIYVQTSSGSSINVVPDESTARSRLPDLRVSDFRNGMRSKFKNVRQAEFQRFSQLQPSHTITIASNLANGQQIWLISDISTTSQKLQTKGIHAVCGVRENDSIYAKSVHPSSE